MNDFEYDCYQKKVTGRSAVHRKCGSKSKRCSLPSDRLTAAQRKKLNGRVVTYQMKRPMSWKEFKEMPPEIQNEYVSGLLDTYDIAGSQLCDMFGVHPSTLHRVLQKNCPAVRLKRGKHVTVESLAAWDQFLGDFQTQKTPEFLALPKEPVEVSEEPEETAAEPEKPCDLMQVPESYTEDSEDAQLAQEPVTSRMESFHIRFNGMIDLDQVFNSLRMVLGGRSVPGSIEIICSNLHNSP